MSTQKEQNNKPGQIKDQSLNWEINESLLQSHRSIFIASQSLLIATVSLTEKYLLLNFIIINIAIFQLWIGFTVIVARARIVDFYKYNLSEFECSEEDYSNKSQERRRVKEQYQVENTLKLEHWRPTRIKIDFWMPVSFLVIWALFMTKSCAKWICPNSPIYFHLILFLLISTIAFLVFKPVVKKAFEGEPIYLNS